MKGLLASVLFALGTVAYRLHLWDMAQHCYDAGRKLGGRIEW